jgi:hypothetical protein
VSEQPSGVRPPCAVASAATAEPLAATASRVEHWLVVEFAGFWPYDPLDATIFAGDLRAHLQGQLGSLANSRLFLVRRPAHERDGRVRVVYGASPERGARAHSLELDSHADLAGLDFAATLRGERAPEGEPHERPLLLVCTHGKRDRCCASFGRDLCTRLHRLADPDWVWQSSHVGGDRFAGNLVCLPEGLYFGRLGTGAVEDVLSAYVEGRIELEHYRGRSCYPFHVQAAELCVRSETGLTGFHDVRLVGRRRLAADRWSVDLLAEVAGDVYRVEVAAELGRETYLTCHAPVPRRPRRFAARSCERL